MVETEVDPEIETKTDEKEDVSPAKRRVIKPETAKKHKAEEEEGLDLDLTPDLTGGCITAEGETHAPILEKGEDQEEETLEIEDRDLLIPEIEDIPETPETVEEMIEVCQDHHPIANIVDLREDRSQEEKPLKTDVQEVDLLAKVILKPEQWKEKVSQEVCQKEELKEMVLPTKCLKVKLETALLNKFHKFLDLVPLLKSKVVTALTQSSKKRKPKIYE